MNPGASTRRHLDALLGQFDGAGAIARDPIRFPRRYADPADAELAGVVAALLAYGRVDLFGPVIERLLARMDDAGGPHRYLSSFDGDPFLDDVVYRWNRGPDFVLLYTALRRVLAEHGSVGAVFAPGPAAASLSGAIATLRGLSPTPWTRGYRTWLTDPADGSACKRWLMLMRWMVRRDGGDLGLWAHLSPADLVIPVDTHVHRVSRFLGLTRRSTADWRAAEEITTALRRFDPRDPVKYDFALAHLGISGACLGHREVAVCSGCRLDPVCRAPAAAPSRPAAPRSPRRDRAAPS